MSPDYLEICSTGPHSRDTKAMCHARIAIQHAIETLQHCRIWPHAHTAQPAAGIIQHDANHCTLHITCRWGITGITQRQGSAQRTNNPTAATPQTYWTQNQLKHRLFAPVHTSHCFEDPVAHMQQKNVYVSENLQQKHLENSPRMRFHHARTTDVLCSIPASCTPTACLEATTSDSV